MSLLRLAPFLLIFVAARAAGPGITQLRIRPGGVDLGWDQCTNRYIIEQFVPGQPEATAVASSSGIVESTVSLALPDAAAVFYRLRVGLQAVRLADASLDQAVRSAVPPGAPGPTNWLYDTQVRGLTNLQVAVRGVSSLEGLAGLADLVWFDAGGNRLASLAALAGCHGLRALRVDGNRLADLSGIEALVDLETLDVSHNAISDLGPLAGLTGLTALYADHNGIESLVPLAGLRGLATLDLSHNRITDLTPLLDNARAGGLGEGDAVYLSGNPIASERQVADLRGFGVTVYYP